MSGPGTGYGSINVADGLTLLNVAGTAPGTLDIASLYQVTIEDATPLNNLTINFQNYNNEYLNGSFTAPLVLGSKAIVTQSTASSEAQIGGLALTNNGTIIASAGSSYFIIDSTTLPTPAR